MLRTGVGVTFLAIRERMSTAGIMTAIIGTDTVTHNCGRSLDNETSFWITKPSLLNLLHFLGFTTVAEILRPIAFLDYSDRITLAAIKGSLQTNALQPDYPENLKLSPHPGQARYFAPPPRKPPVWNRALFKARQILKLN